MRDGSRGSGIQGLKVGNLLLHLIIEVAHLAVDQGLVANIEFIEHPHSVANSRRVLLIPLNWSALRLDDSLHRSRDKRIKYGQN